MRLSSRKQPQRAWQSNEAALEFAFGHQMQRPSVAVLMHRNRLAEIKQLISGSCREFSARWKGLVWTTPFGRITFIVTEKGASDVGDCLLHLSASPPNIVLYTGTCGGVNPDISVGQLCLVLEGWLSDSFSSWAQDPFMAVARAKPAQSLLANRSSKLVNQINSLQGLQVIQASVFTTASQSCESDRIIKSVLGLGADVIDMETGVLLYVAGLCKIRSLALLWCTDTPSRDSYYDCNNPLISDLNSQVWTSWPKWAIEVAGLLARLYSKP